jgi:hypothetical protein
VVKAASTTIGEAVRFFTFARMDFYIGGAADFEPAEGSKIGVTEHCTRG